MFGWRLEFSEGKNVSVPLEGVITNDKCSLGLKEDAKCKLFIFLWKDKLYSSQAKFAP